MTDSVDRARVTLVATRTIDFIPRPDGRVFERPGGPAYYAGQALELLRCPYQLITGPPTRSEVVFGPHGEEYLIPQLPLIPLPERFDTKAVILSPIMQEIAPSSVSRTDGILAIDLQGFVRVPMTPFHEVRSQFALADLLSLATIVKGGAQEIERLDSASRRALRDCTLFVTEGAHGVTVCKGDRKQHIPATPIDAASTIGAGDAFLAAAVVAMLEGLDADEAALQATRFVERMLLDRRNETVNV